MGENERGGGDGEVKGDEEEDRKGGRSSLKGAVCVYELLMQKHGSQ